MERRFLTGLILVLTLMPSVVSATHEVDHRFLVYGYVRDDSGRPIQDAKVMVVDTRIGEGSTAFTDRSGYYEVLLHLHNDNLGDEIRITTLDQVKTVTANFNPEDRNTVRKVQVDFGAPPSEEPSAVQTYWVYGTGAALVLAIFLYWGLFSRRKKAKAESRGWKKGKKK